MSKKWIIFSITIINHLLTFPIILNIPIPLDRKHKLTHKNQRLCRYIIYVICWLIAQDDGLSLNVRVLEQVANINISSFSTSTRNLSLQWLSLNQVALESDIVGRLYPSDSLVVYHPSYQRLSPDGTRTCVCLYEKNEKFLGNNRENVPFE